MLISSSGIVWVMSESMSILPSMYQSTIFGTSVRPRAPPKAVPRQLRPGDELERPRRDFLAGFRNADNDAGAPAAMAAFQRLAHDIGVAGCVEGEIRAAIGQLLDRLHNLVIANFVRIDEVGHAELLRHCHLAGVEIDTDDLVRAHHARALNDIEADTTQTEYHDIRAGPDLARIDHGTDAGGDATADVADLVEGRVLAHFRQARSPAEQ